MKEDPAHDTPYVRRGPATLACLAVVAVFLFVGFFALGTWQVQRRAWKLDLIARVDQRVHASPAPAPGPAQWPGIDADADAYRRVALAGRYIYDRETLVQASTELGSGYWVMTPLRRPDGTVFLVNRGFVPGDARDRITHGKPGQQDDVTVFGLLRISEPGGGFLRDNDPAADRWYSRDVAAIAATRKLQNVAPYFVDAAADPRAAPGDWPVGGLTVIAFHNSHLVYAITWYTLALMVAGATFYVLRDERRQRGRACGATLPAKGERAHDHVDR